MTSRKHGRPEHLGVLLEKARQESAKLAGAGPISHDLWQQIVGPRIAARTQPKRLENGVLMIGASSPVWAQELAFLSDEITARLRGVGMQVTKIRFQVTTIDLPPETVVETRIRALPVALPQDLLDQLAEVEDPDLRAAIAEAAGLFLARESLDQEPGTGTPPGRGRF